MSNAPARPRRARPPAASANHVSARVDAATVTRLDALAALVTPPGIKPSRSLAVRACIVTGLDTLEARHAKSKGAP